MNIVQIVFNALNCVDESLSPLNPAISSENYALIHGYILNRCTDFEKLE